MKRLILTIGIGLLAAMSVQAANHGTFDRWSKIELDFDGPASSATGSPNPFAILLDVTFTAPSGATTTVPGFYDGNGSGGAAGNVWRVRFSADEDGSWSFRTSSSQASLNNVTGTFNVVAPSGSSPSFYRWGRLEAVGTAANGVRYLKFRDGPYWLKAGCDDPENFLGDDFANYDTDAERLAAIDFLADRGINSMYMLTHNIGGDNNDVWPWLGTSTSEAQNNASGDVRFDIPRLHSWLNLFETMQVRGIVPYLILEDDSAWTGYDHARYYRELVARFGHMPALLFRWTPTSGRTTPTSPRSRPSAATPSSTTTSHWTGSRPARRWASAC